MGSRKVIICPLYSTVVFLEHEQCSFQLSTFWVKVKLIFIFQWNGFFSFIILKLLFHCLLASVVSDELLDVHQIIAPPYKNVSSGYLQDYLLSMCFSSLTIMFLDMQLIFYIFFLELTEFIEWKIFMSLAKFGEFSAIFFLIFFLAHSLISFLKY